MTTLPDIQPAFTRTPADGDPDLRDPAQLAALNVMRAAHQAIHGRPNGQVAVRSFARLDSDTDLVLFQDPDGKELWRTAPVAWVLLNRAARHIGLDIVEFRRRLNTNTALRELGEYVLVFTVTTPDIAAKARNRRPGEDLDDFFYSLIPTIQGAYDFERGFSMEDFPATWPTSPDQARDEARLIRELAASVERDILGDEADKPDAIHHSLGFDKGAPGGDRLITQQFYIPDPDLAPTDVSSDDLARARDHIAKATDDWLNQNIARAFGLDPDDLGVAKTKPRRETPKLTGGQDAGQDSD